MGNRTFYVSNTGSDANDGLSPVEPWQSLAKVSQQVFGPGDTILLKTGDIWEEAVEIKGQGTERNPIVVSAYGELAKPILRFAKGDVIKAVNPSHLVIRGLQIECTTDLPLFPDAEYRNFHRQHSPYPLNRGIYLEFTGAVQCSGIVIEDNVVCGPGVDSFTEGINALVWYPAAPGSLQENVVSGLHLIGNTIHSLGWVGLTTSGECSGKNEAVWYPQFLFRAVKMLHNTVFDIGVQGLLLCHGTDSMMKWNTVHHAGMYAGKGLKWSPAGLWVWSSKNVDLMFNEVYKMQDSNSGNDATGFDIDWHSEEIRVTYNHAHDNYGNGIVTMACRNSEISRNRLAGNRCQLNCGKGQIGLTNWHQDQADDCITNVENLKMTDNCIFIDRDDTGALNTLKTAPGPAWQGNAFTGNRIILKKGIKPSFLYDIQPDAAVDQIGGNTFYGFPAAFHTQGATTDSFLEICNHPPILICYLAGAWDAATCTVSLSWQVDTPSSHIHHFNIHRSATPDFTPKYTNMIGQTKGVAFTDTVETDANTAYYIVQAEDMAGEYGHLAEIEVKTPR